MEVTVIVRTISTSVCLAAAGLFLSACGSTSESGCNPQCEPGQDFCIDLNSGARVTAECEPYCPPGVDCTFNNNNGDGNGGPDDNNNNNNNNPPGPIDGNNNNNNPSPSFVCECVGDFEVEGDADNDCIVDSVETEGGISDPTQIDTDNDGINDGCEDRNRDGVVNGTETDPREADSDSDGIPDGVEDANQNGRVDGDESDPRDVDTDNDGIRDGVEDANGNGVVDGWVDVDDDGCFTRGVDTPGETSPRLQDTDLDGILDAIEDGNGDGICDTFETCAFLVDTDCDLVRDGSEDLNRNGIQDPFEMDPLDQDTDNDGLLDGVEDADRNGVWAPGTETNPRAADTDGDGIADGVEDANRNGMVDAFVDANSNGCYDAAGDTPETPGESDPKSRDSDGDGIADNLEDLDQNGQCRFGILTDPLNPGATVAGFEETCAFAADTDCDGLADGLEDATRDGVRNDGELDPRNPDSDFDGLFDGCLGTPATCGGEDLNNNGRWDRGDGETNARSADTDRDGVLDGCELFFNGTCSNDGSPCASNGECAAGATCMSDMPAGSVSARLDPLDEDTDDDGLLDGEEDADGSCSVNNGETDPRIAEPPPADGTLDLARFRVCSPTANTDLNIAGVKRLTFAESIRLDYRLAFEVERNPQTGDEAEYLSFPVGYDVDGEGFDPLEPLDQPVGHVFQSPAGVITRIVDTSVEVLNRDVYGFVTAREDDRALDTILDEIRDLLPAGLVSLGAGSSVVETSAVTARPAHDNLPRARILRAQRQFDIVLTAPASSIGVRNELFDDVFSPASFSLLDEGTFTPGGPNLPQIGTLPNVDLAYNTTVTCPTDTDLCYSRFALQVAAVQRLDQEGVNGKPVTLVVVALTPNDSDNDPGQLFPDRVERLEDLTGGSAVARFAAETDSECEENNQQLAVADVMWVVDDSASMQQIIDRLQQAAEAAQTVFTANSNIVDYRLAMTTTNGAPVAKRVCSESCFADGLNDAGLNCDNEFFNSNSIRTLTDGGLGCEKLCPTGCDASCSGGSCDATLCGTTCIPPAEYFTELNASLDFNDFTGRAAVLTNGQILLPGGGGSFYYEDSQLMDCNSGVDSDEGGINPCSDDVDFAAFYNGGNPVALLGNQGFIGAADFDTPMPDSCADFSGADLAFVDLRSDTSVGAADCVNDPEDCCRRLIGECTHGPTVLASQMCDLIRSMGGKPDLGIDGFPLPSSGRRSHSAPEYGSLQARRTLQNALPALPQPLTGDPDPSRLRLNCFDGDENCTACNPGETVATSVACASDDDCTAPRTRCNEGSATCEVFCDIVPVVSVFLSDEEDFLFKDECAGSYRQARPGDTPTDSQLFNWENSARATADERQLAADCRYVDGDPNTVESCDVVDPEPGVDTPYCDRFDTGLPAGYDPSVIPATVDEFSMQWRDREAAACDPENEFNCAGDPCALARNQTECEAPQANDGVNPTAAACVWDDTESECLSRCEGANEGNDVAAARTTCEADPICTYLPELQRQLGNGDFVPGDACQFRYPLNDCQACKRQRRRNEAVNGDTMLVGLGEVGPVYAIVRNRGLPGSPENDACQGGSVTWGRGDGSAYRDFAIDTQGRTQDVCADSYQGFVQDLVRDIVSLSQPYPLDEFPISATIRVGIARETASGSGVFDFFEVPRSSTQGFTYDATANSIGFKSDPVDGQCGGGGCAVDGVITQDEVDFARTRDFVPIEGDIIFISYRSWLPVPCEEQCGDNETCVRVLCPEEGGGFTGVECDTDSDCGLNEICNIEVATPTCQLVCDADDTTVDRCIPAPCGVCEVLVGDVCQPIITDPDDPASCECVPNPEEAVFCQDNASCPRGTTCLEDSCFCTPVASCADSLGAGLDLTGALSVEQCNLLTGCCSEVASADLECRGRSLDVCTASQTVEGIDCVIDNGLCISSEALCCPTGEIFECQADPESPFVFTACEPGECECEFPARDGTATCSSDMDCALTCEQFAAPNCPAGCQEESGVCILAAGSPGPDPAFQPQVCDLTMGACVCNFDGFICDTNTANGATNGCGCVPRPF
ncbi:MAG: hypothetical protein AAF654_08160 [Myxococcota bacterium]